MFPGDKKILRFLASPRLALYLIIMMTAVFITGMIKNPWSATPVGLSVPAIFTTPVFLLMVFMFLVNLFLCTVRQFLGIVRENRSPVAREKMECIGTYPGILAPKDINDINDVLKGHDFKTQIMTDNDTAVIYGRKNVPGKWGSVVFHAGLILVVVGGFLDLGAGMNGSFGLYEGGRFTDDSHQSYAYIREGVLRPERHGDFEIVLNGIRTRYKPTGTSASADVSFIKNGVEVKRELVDTSNYLSYGINHVYFRLNGYYAAVILKDQKGKELVKTLIGLDTMKHGTSEQYTAKFELPGTAYSGYMEFFPDYNRIRKARVPGSYEPKNPALQIVMNHKAGQQQKTVFSGVLGTGETAAMKDGTSFTFYNVVPWVSFYAKVEPGLYFVYSGFFVSIIGLSLLYGFTPEFIKLALQLSEKGTEVRIYGRASRFQDNFRSKFKLLKIDISAVLSGKETSQEKENIP